MSEMSAWIMNAAWERRMEDKLEDQELNYNSPLSLFCFGFYLSVETSWCSVYWVSKTQRRKKKAEGVLVQLGDI